MELSSFPANGNYAQIYLFFGTNKSSCLHHVTLIWEKHWGEAGKGKGYKKNKHFTWLHTFKNFKQVYSFPVLHDDADWIHNNRFSVSSLIIIKTQAAMLILQPSNWSTEIRTTGPSAGGNGLIHKSHGSVYISKSFMFRNRHLLATMKDGKSSLFFYAHQK